MEVFTGTIDFDRSYQNVLWGLLHYHHHNCHHSSPISLKMISVYAMHACGVLSTILFVALTELPSNGGNTHWGSGCRHARSRYSDINGDGRTWIEGTGRGGNHLGWIASTQTQCPLVRDQRYPATVLVPKSFLRSEDMKMRHRKANFQISMFWALVMERQVYELRGIWHSSCTCMLQKYRFWSL